MPARGFRPASGARAKAFRGLTRIALAVVALLAAAIPAGAAEQGQKLATYVSRIDHFEIGSSRIRFGALDFVGGLEVTSDSRLLGGMSSIRMLPDRQSFIGVMDTGYWFSGRFKRDSAGRLADISDFRISPLLGEGAAPLEEKWVSDAEAIAVRDDDVLVGFERDHRILAYPRRDPEGSGAIARLPLPFPVEELRMNSGIETVAVSPASGPLAGATVAVSEMSINGAGDIYAGILDGSERGTFFVRRNPPFAISDGAFLPNGDLLLLERSFSLLEGLQVRIRRVAGDTIRPGATVDGDAIFEASLGDQVDNMEGISVDRGADGRIYVLLVSDDNNSILQRNLFLEFRLAE